MTAPLREQFTNNATTTLSAAITSTGATSLSVTSASGFPSVGNFRILIGSEILKVTAVSGTTFTVVRGVEGTSAATHLNASAVSLVLTAGSLTQLVKDNIFVDSGVPILGIYDNSGSPITSSSFTAINGNSSTITDDGNTITISAPIQSGVNLTYLYIAQPTPPYAYVGAFRVATMGDGTNSPGFGLAMMDSGTGDLIAMQCYLNNSAPGVNFQVEKTTITSFTSAIVGPGAGQFIGDLLWIKMSSDGTHVHFYISPNGITWVDFGAVTIASYLTTPDRVGFFADNNNNGQGPLVVNCAAWQRVS